jgi:hypothetical protein
MNQPFWFLRTRKHLSCKLCSTLSNSTKGARSPQRTFLQFGLGLGLGLVCLHREKCSSTTTHTCIPNGFQTGNDTDSSIATGSLKRNAQIQWKSALIPLSTCFERFKRVTMRTFHTRILMCVSITHLTPTHSQLVSRSLKLLDQLFFFLVHLWTPKTENPCAHTHRNPAHKEIHIQKSTHRNPHTRKSRTRKLIRTQKIHTHRKSTHRNPHTEIRTRNPMYVHQILFSSPR